jgi:branched-chain amino acid transport system permease protein
MTAATNLRQVPLLKRYLTFTWITLGLAAVILLLSAFNSPSLLVNTLVSGGMWALMAGGLALVFGVMNIPNFAHGELFMVGSLVASLVYAPIRQVVLDNPTNTLLKWAGPFVGILVACAVGFVAGVIIEGTVFRQLRKRSRESWMMNTFLLTAGVSVIMQNTDMLVFGNFPRGISRYWDFRPINILGVTLAVDRIMVFIIAMVVLVAFALFLQKTRTGRAMRAVSMDETGAQMAGISLNGVYRLTLGLSSALAALAGASLLWLNPATPTVGQAPLLVAWYVVILAGLGNVQGAIIGGFLVAMIQQFTAYYISLDWVDVVPTAFIILVLLFKPSGLFGSEVKGVWEQ